MQTKKSQFFMMDLIFSFVIIVIAVGIALFYTTSPFQDEGLYDLNNNIIQQFTTIPVNNLNNEEIRNFFLTNQITNVDNTIAQQVAEFYVKGEIADAELLTNVFIETYERRNIYINISFRNETSSFDAYVTQNAQDFENSKANYINNREILLVSENTVKTFNVEVRMWQ